MLSKSKPLDEPADHACVLTLRVSPIVPFLPLSEEKHGKLSSPPRRKWVDTPALRTSLLSSFAFKAAQALLFSHSSLPQQQVHAFSGSGEERREAFDNAFVSSSIVVVARCRLLASCESGVSGRDIAMVGESQKRQ